MSEVAIADGLKQGLLVLCISLSVAILPQILSWFRQIPYTLMLVIVGLGLALVDIRLIDLSPELILTIFLPPLLFEAAWNLRWSNLKQQVVPIGFYAVVGVVISIAGVAVGLTQFAGVSLSTALLIGACLSATDPVSVVALFRELGVDKQLSTVIEGESLFNDGMAVVAFTFLVGFALGETELAPKSIFLELVAVIGVGAGVGALIGAALSYLTQRFDLPLVEQSLTLVSAYGAYLLAEELGGSGVIATVTTGLILGNYGSRIGMNPRTRMIVSEFWDFLAFFVNSIVFLTIGDQIRTELLRENAWAIVVTILAMTVSRAVAIYGLGYLSNRLANSELTGAEQTILWWGGLRGSVSIALALSVPVTLSDRPAIITTVLQAVLFTLLVQGLLLKPLLAALNLLGDLPQKQRYLEAIARGVALNRVLQWLQQSDRRPGIEPEFYDAQTELVRGELVRIEQDVDQLDDEYPNLHEFAKEQLQAELLAIEADTYAEFVQMGKLDRELTPLLEPLTHSTLDDFVASVSPESRKESQPQ